MIDPLQAFLEANSLLTPVFPQGSRYHGLGTGEQAMPDGRTVAFVKRRFVPSPLNFAVLHEHAVEEGDRLDNLAHRYLGDAQQYWRLCDANGALRPEELVETIGRRLRITLPEGMPGARDD